MRLRFILSHVLPLLIVIPLVGILLIVSFERTIIVPQVRAEVHDDLELLRALITSSPLFVEDLSSTQGMIDAFYQQQDCCIRLMDTSGRLVVSNNPADRSVYGDVMEDPAVQDALAGEEVIRTRFSQRRDRDVVEGLGPIYAPTGDLIGVIQVTHPLDTLGQNLFRVRGMVLWILTGGLAVGVLLGATLSSGLAGPLRRLTSAIDRMRAGEEVNMVEIAGPAELRDLALSFNELLLALRSEEDTRRHLVANMVHELGRPLGAMRSAVVALSSGADKDPELKASLLAGIDSHTRQLERLADDLTHLHETSSGRPNVEPRRIDLRQWLTNVSAPWRSFAKERGIEWVQDIDELPAAWIDPDRMSQALGNLLDNALKFTPRGGTVELRASAEHGQAIISVEDTGVGLSEEDLRNLFTLFYIGHSRQRFPEGMGLGLNIAKEIVEVHGGTIDAQALPEGGSRFTIRIPLPGGSAR
jgi:two-component system sensor histidine kinase BaeS